MLTLAACAHDDSLGATFSMRLEPASLHVRMTESVMVQVVIVRSGGFANPVTVTLLGSPPGVTAEPLTVEQERGTLLVGVTDEAQVGTAFVTVQGLAGTHKRTETLTLQVARAVAGVDGVTRAGPDDSREVRQGLGAVDLIVTGNNLERVTAMNLGDLEVEVTALTPHRLQLSVAVPHGANPGPKDLVLSTAGGETTFHGALEVTPITAGPTGADTAGDGTLARPFRTLTYALAHAAAGDTVRLLAGTYAEAERWPRLTDPVPAPNVPAGVLIRGEDPERVILQGAASEAGLWFAGAGEATGLQVTGFGTGVNVTREHVTLGDLIVASTDSGLEVAGGEVFVSDSVFMANRGTSITIDGEALVKMTGGGVNGGELDGVIVSGAATFNAVGVAVSQNQQAGIRARGSAHLLLQDVRVEQNGVHGIRVEESSSAQLRGGEYERNAVTGIWFGGARLELRGVTLVDNGVYGLYVTNTPQRVDLGTFRDAGGNSFGGTQYLHLGDGRPARVSLETPIIFTVSATTFDGLELGPNVYVGPHSAADSPIAIIYANNVIQFY